MSGLDGSDGRRPVDGITAALFDFGGVIISSPFEAFARYEQAQGLPVGFLRRVNATDPDGNAWARLERNELDLDEFCARFEAEARALGGEVDAREVLALLRGELRPAMVTAVRRCGERLKTALLTNNVVTMRAPHRAEALPDRSGASVGSDGSDGSDGTIGADASTEGGGDDDPHLAVLGLFDVIVESSVVGVRKPDPAFYERACAALSIDPSEAVFLDDLGVNLKPARAMGMTTIKVDDPAVAIAELEAVVGFPLS